MENKFQFAKNIIRDAGDFIKSNMIKGLEIEEKTRFDDLVTNLDKATQELLITKIKQAYPSDHILAEEIVYITILPMVMSGYLTRLMVLSILWRKVRILLL